MYNNRTPQKPEQPLQKHKNPTAGNTEKENARALQQIANHQNREKLKKHQTYYLVFPVRPLKIP
jgi:hypothetical protein